MKVCQPKDEMKNFPEKAQLTYRKIRGYSGKYFSYFSMKTSVVGTQWKQLIEALPMGTHNICFCGEIRKISEFFG